MSRPSPAPGSVRPRNSDPSVAVAPVPGVSSSLLTRAIRRVEARWRELYGPSTDIADIPRILAASALAADRGEAGAANAQPVARRARRHRTAIPAAAGRAARRHRWPRVLDRVRARHALAAQFPAPPGRPAAAGLERTADAAAAQAAAADLCRGARA